ncbi:MAG: hypothetical protein ABJK37_22660 [Paraglaciecola sp.]|uniref:hypothetical protein n=1 Tax=Paraglaciecola sp. TaxID=1920173 RepID=UPI00329A255B
MLQKIVVNTLFSSFILLTACGGGGGNETSGGVVGDGGGTSDGGGTGDGGGELNSLLTFQTFGLERIDYDYDNNGVAEGVETFSYDDSGRLVLSTYLYTADGTADLPASFGNPHRGFMTVEITYTYDDIGRVIKSNNIAVSNTSPDASSSRASRTIDFTFEYKDDSEYPMSITENYLDESDVPLYRHTDIFTYNEEDSLENVVREYDPSVSSTSINNPGYLYSVVYEYSDTIGSIPTYNYLDEFLVATIFNYSSDGLISSAIVTNDANMSLPPPRLSSIVEYSYNDRGCLISFNSGLYDDSGEIDKKQSMEITFGSQDRITLREYDGDFDGIVDGSESYFYGNVGNTTWPYNAVQFGYPHVYLQGQKTNCLTD